MEMKTKIVCIGTASKDILLPINDGLVLETPEDVTAKVKIAFELGAKYQIDDRFEAIGGCAANVSVGLTRLGMTAYCYSRVGVDQLGKWIVAELDKNGVFTDLVQVDEVCKSDLSAILVHQKLEDRVVFFNRDANERLEIHPEQIAGFDWVFVSALNGNSDADWTQHLDSIIQTAVNRGIKVILNPGQKNIKDNVIKVLDAVRHTTILILNKDEAVEIILGGQLGSGESLNDEVFLARTLAAEGPSIVVVTDGARGAWGYCAEEAWHANSLHENVLDTIGAGDAFTSAFLAGYFSGQPIKVNLAWGIANSSSSIRFYGAIDGLLDRKTLEERVGQVAVERIG
ncbi:carbohydrate kinase family protein [Patescibacteria group bacterium]|nr:MAG: carbohydrate kinase family protein [Patescibacteria group bacterium]